MRMRPSLISFSPCPDRSAGPGELSWTDARLVRECVGGNEAAWAALVDKYKNLIFSIPIKQGMPRDDAADVFQRVCLLLLAELPHLREPKALPMWLIRVTSRECYRWRRQEHPYPARDLARADTATIADEQPLADEMLVRIKDEQALRDALRALPTRCRELIEMLFFETPARPYREIASKLGLATGSIGFIRGRCLGRLRRELDKAGFR
jgi:RNA polymerase sigma factor (sigma-70 family)